MEIITKDAMKESLRAYCEAKKQGDVANEIGISQQYLSLMINGTRAVSKKVAAHLGYKKIVSYEKSEISE